MTYLTTWICRFCGGKLLPGRTVTETTGHGKRTVSMLLNGATITRHKAS